MYGCAPHTGDLTWPATQACALTVNQTSDPLVHRLALSPLSHSSQGDFVFFKDGIYLLLVRGGGREGSVAFPCRSRAARTKALPVVRLCEHLFGDRDPLKYSTGCNPPSPQSACRQNGVCQHSMSPLHLTSGPLLLVFPFYYSSSLFLWLPLPTLTSFR